MVWCPKYRLPVLAGPVKDCSEALFQEKAARHGPIIVLEVMPDHLHLVGKVHPRHWPAYLDNQFKDFTCHTLRAKFPHLRSRLPTLWSKSYFAATVGAASAATVQRYIDTQYEWPWRKGKTP